MYVFECCYRQVVGSIVREQVDGRSWTGALDVAGYRPPGRIANAVKNTGIPETIKKCKVEEPTC
jgi:hypothetical protein